MLIEIAHTRNYLFSALTEAPALFEYLLRDLSEGEADFTPDPQRFTIREIVAHLAEMEAVFLTRLELTCALDRPVSPTANPGELAILHKYAESDIGQQFELYKSTRAVTVEFLQAREATDWQRVVQREGLGDFTLEAQALHMVLHDGYHQRQIAQWRGRA